MQPSDTLIEFLEDLLARARRGEVHVAIAAALCTGEQPGDADVLTCAVLGEQLRKADPDSLRNGFVATARGVASATQAVHNGVEEELAGRGRLVS